MPPKKKAAKRPAKSPAKGPAPKRQSTLEKAIDQMTTIAKKDSKQKTHKVDKACALSNNSNAAVHEDYDCMLNQTNIGHNNNKYYVIQVICCNNAYHTFTRWGRVGEPGQQQLFTFGNDADGAIKQFEKKFTDKTKNKWENRDKFKPVAGKYTLIDVGEDDDEPQPSKANLPIKSTGSTKASGLDKETQELIKLILDKDMFKTAMANMEIDVKKMPLGKLSKMQIVKGFQVLDDIQKILRKEKTGNLTELSNQFYTVIPQDFGRQRPPVINSDDQLRSKLDMLITLSDIELAQDMLKKNEEEQDKKQKAKKEKDLPAHPIDQNYEMLNCDLTLLKAGDQEFKLVKSYFDSTRQHRPSGLLAVWRMDRKPEGTRFKEHEKVPNRKLLWHGTNVAVVAAILKSGLRIMPHSGGRVGRGLYFASECDKSAGYVCPSGNTGIMFLNEVVLGKEHHVLQNQSHLTAAPKGFESVVAQGWTEPDPKADHKLKLDGKEVVVPQGKPVTRSQYKSKSHFSQTEYLVYKESQVRMRYLLKCKF